MNTNLLAVPQFAVEAAIKAISTLELACGAFGNTTPNEFHLAKQCLEQAVKQGTPTMPDDVYKALWQQSSKETPGT